MTKLNLGTTTNCTDIKESVRRKQSIEFLATSAQVNLTDPEINEYIDKIGAIALPPLLNKSAIFQALWQMNPTTDSIKWDYIILLTYLNDGAIYYQKIDENYYLVTIKF
jgi:hypothetical protein